uniref:Uncharacterized protein n=1 Tax=Panagrolaimus davidi TaxID=227884 RepID=A0A914P8V9_9BILA
MDQKIFTWAENQAREKAADYESLNLENQQKLIKAEMSEFLPKFKFNFRSEDFMNDFVAPRSYIFDDWDGFYDAAINDFDFIETENIQFYVKYPVNELIEHIESFQNVNGAYYMNPSWERWIPHLKFLDDLKYLEEQTQYCLGFHCHSRIAIIDTKIFEYNQIYMDVYKSVCYLEGKNFPTFEKEETDFYIQIL